MSILHELETPGATPRPPRRRAAAPATTNETLVGHGHTRMRATDATQRSHAPVDGDRDGHPVDCVEDEVDLRGHINVHIKVGFVARQASTQPWQEERLA